jgi:hypothetical protein
MRGINRMLGGVQPCNPPMDRADLPRNVIDASHVSFMVEVDCHLAAGTVHRQSPDNRLQVHRNIDDPVVLHHSVGSSSRNVEPAYSKHI